DANEQRQRAEDAEKNERQRAEGEKKERLRAERNERTALAEKARAERALANNLIALAEAEWRSGPPGVALARLDTIPPSLRFWEWHYLKRSYTGGVFQLASENQLRSLACSAAGRLLAAGGKNVVELWDAAGCQRVRTLRGHERWIERVVFSHDGRRLASA